jgi:hypothetical protein
MRILFSLLLFFLCGCGSIPQKKPSGSEDLDPKEILKELAGQPLIEDEDC